MTKRDTILNLISTNKQPDSIPAAFFLHFDEAYHRGRAAIDKQLEFFNHTGMDFIKVQYEQVQPATFRASKAADWLNAPRYSAAYFQPTVEVVEGLVKAAKGETLVVLTVYSPFMWAKQLVAGATLADHFRENPDAVAQGLAAMTDNVVQLVRACKQVGADGFYVSTQGGEATRFPGTDIFTKYIKPTDLAVWNEIGDCAFNILHICDYEAPYNDLSTFLDYPGHVVNCSLVVGDRTMTAREASDYFGRPFMGGIERKGVISTGSREEVRKEAEHVLAQAPERFILGADCTVLADTPWDNLKTAVDSAHHYRK